MLHVKIHAVSRKPGMEELKMVANFFFFFFFQLKKNTLGQKQNKKKLVYLFVIV